MSGVQIPLRVLRYVVAQLAESSVEDTQRDMGSNPISYLKWVWKVSTLVKAACGTLADHGSIPC